MKSKVNGKASATQFAVMLDQQGTRYLRVGSDMGSVHLAYNNGHTVDIVKMDNATIRSRDLRPVPGASILDAARQLVKPLNSGVKVSPQASDLLKAILQNKELIEMAKISVVRKQTAATEEAAPAARTKKPVLVKGAKNAAAPAKAAKAKAAKDESPANGRHNDELYETKVVATDKATGAREGSFWAQLGKLASKPITLSTLINRVTANPAGIRSEKLAGDSDALAASVRIRVRDAYTRLGFLKTAK